MPSTDFSLLYPSGISIDPSRICELGVAARHDLGVENLIAAFTTNAEHQKVINEIFSQLLCDPEIISYRLDVIDDLVHNPSLVGRLEALLPVIDSLFLYSYRPERAVSSLHEVTWRMGELQNIIDCIEGFGEILTLAKADVNSQGLRTLQEEVQKTRDNPTYQNLILELPNLLSKLRSCASITIGVNLDASLHPVQAALLSINNERFTNQSLLGKLFGLQKGQAGVAPLHSVPQRMVSGNVALPISSDLGWAVEPMMVPLFADLAKVLEKTTAPITKSLRQFTEIQSQLLVNLRQALIYYLGAVRFIWSLQALGLPVCRPQMAAAEARVCDVQDAYNVNLVLRSAPVASEPASALVTTNDIHFGPTGRILILTGPNQGGKTTYIQGVGLVQVLAQIGCYVPGRQASISPVDHLFTHFPLEEKPESDTGRFGDEALRLGKIFGQVTRHSLVLLNETLSSTSFGESLYLAQDLVRVMRRVGVRALYSTHLHELAERADELNSSVSGDSLILSLVSSPIEPDVQLLDADIQRTYQIEVRPPLGQSYARGLAARYGISYQQLEQVLAERGVLPAEEC